MRNLGRNTWNMSRHRKSQHHIEKMKKINRIKELKAELKKLEKE